jgi:hypothetical protein
MKVVGGKPTHILLVAQITIEDTDLILPLAVLGNGSALLIPTAHRSLLTGG